MYSNFHQFAASIVLNFFLKNQKMQTLSCLVKFFFFKLMISLHAEASIILKLILKGHSGSFYLKKI